MVKNWRNTTPRGVWGKHCLSHAQPSKPVIPSVLVTPWSLPVITNRPIDSKGIFFWGTHGNLPSGQKAHSFQRSVAATSKVQSLNVPLLGQPPRTIHSPTVTPTGLSVEKHPLPFQSHLSQIPLTGGGPGLTDWEQAGQLFCMGTARDITTSAMLVPCQLPQGWEERGCQTAKISGQGQRQAGPSTQMHRGGGAGAGAGRRLCLQLEGGAYGWGSRSKPLSLGLRGEGGGELG